MPNVASSVAEGMTILSYSPECCSEFQSFANILFGSMGEIAELAESLMDIASVMAGCGPGFVFRLIEAEARLGEKHGMSYAGALKIAAQSFAGAARLVLKGASPVDLIRTIATPNGVTGAGFDAMTKLEVDKRFQDVIEAAAHRSRELSE
jgi:pyrroline-5-carboxylate reductase